MTDLEAIEDEEVDSCPNCDLEMESRDVSRCGHGYCRWCCRDEHVWEFE